MIERLDQLKLKDLIELSCGDYSVLIENDEVPTVEEFTSQSARIMAEYKAIATPVQAMMDIAEAGQASKLIIKGKSARIAMMLSKLGHTEMAKNILLELGIGEQYLSSDTAVEARCQSIIGEMEYEMKRIEQLNGQRNGKMKQSPEQIRKSWLAEVASVMSVFKMSIDLTINAAIYANLVHQAVERSKAIAKMPPMARLFM